MIDTSSITVLMFSLISVLANGADQTLKLRPEMQIIKAPGVPMLNVAEGNIPEADRMDKGLKLESEVPFQWVISPGEIFTANISATPLEQSDRVILTVWDWRNAPVTQLKFHIPFAEKIQFKVEGRGTYILTLDRFEADKHLSRLVRSFSVCPSNEEPRRKWNLDQFFIGVASFPDRQDWKTNFGYMRPEGLASRESAEIEADLSARLGIQVIRLNAGLEWIVDMYESKGIKPYLQVWQKGDVLPQYADVTDAKWRYPKQEAPVRAHYADIAKRFGKHALFFEIHNETDNEDFWRGTVEEYIDNFNWALEEFQVHAPNAIVINGGYTLLKPEMTKEYVRAFKDKTHWVAIHTHGDLPYCMDLFQRYKQYHEEAGYKNPVYINTEMGYCGWRLDIERLQAAVAIKKILYFWAHGLRGVMLYNCRDISGPRRDAGWGYIDHFMCPRFKYGAVASIINWYAGATFESILVEKPELHVYSFRANEKFIVTIFSPPNQAKALEVTLKSDGTKALLIDPMGNVNSVCKESLVTVRTEFFPMTVVFEKASHVEIVDVADD